TVCVPTASTNVPTASASVANISQVTSCAYIASQSSGSQIKFEDINQIDEDDIEEMDIKWNMELLSMRAPKALMAIDEVGWDWSYMVNDEEDHALVADEVAPTEFALMANTGAESKKLETLKQEKEGVDEKLADLLTASKDLDNLIESQRSDKNKEGFGYTAIPFPPAQLYLSPKKDLSWTGLPECADDTVIDYSRPSPTVESTSEDGQNRNPSFSEDVASPITPKPFIKKRVQRETTRSQNHVYMSPIHRSIGHRPHGAPMRSPHRSAGHRPHGAPMRPPHRSAGHRPHGPSMNPMRPNMNGAIPNRSFFIQAHSYETRPFLKTSAVKTQYRAPWVPTVNRNNPPVNRKCSTGRRNFPTANRKFPTASRKFPTGSTKIYTADMGRKRKAVKPSAC
nr:hypothetical protein [Tanacetum cinerariifolium]